MACFRFVTFRPDPLFNFPFLNAFISRSTLLEAFGPYFLPLDFLLEDFLLAAFLLEVFFADLRALLELLDRLVGMTLSCCR